jgi:hypothetical protein
MANSDDRGKSTRAAQILIEMTRSVGELGERPMAFARSGGDFEFAARLGARASTSGLTALGRDLALFKAGESLEAPALLHRF